MFHGYLINLACNVVSLVVDSKFVWIKLARDSGVLAKSPGPETPPFMGRRLRVDRRLRGWHTGDSGLFGPYMT